MSFRVGRGWGRFWKGVSVAITSGSERITQNTATTNLKIVHRFCSTLYKRWAVIWGYSKLFYANPMKTNVTLTFEPMTLENVIIVMSW